MEKQISVKKGKKKLILKGCVQVRQICPHLEDSGVHEKETRIVGCVRCWRDHCILPGPQWGIQL